MMRSGAPIGGGRGAAALAAAGGARLPRSGRGRRRDGRFRRRNALALALAPAALQAAHLAIDFVGRGAERRCDVAAGRLPVEEVLAACVQRDLRVHARFSLVSTTCAETALSLSSRSIGASRCSMRRRMLG